MAPEQLLLFGLFLLVALANLVARWLRTRAERRPRVPTDEPEEIVEASRRVPPRVVIRTPQPSRQPALVSAAVPAPARPAPAPAARVRRPPRFRLGGVPDVRRGIVLMTVLGPCRALEPPGPQQPPTRRGDASD